MEPRVSTEVGYLAHDKKLQALNIVPGFKGIIGRDNGVLTHNCHSEGADITMVNQGAVANFDADTDDLVRVDGKRLRL